MARPHEEEDGEWEICEAEPAATVVVEPAAAAAAALELEPSGGESDDRRIEDEFELVDRVSTGDASCESDGEGSMATPRQSQSHTSSCPEDAGAEVATEPAPVPQREDAAQPSTTAVPEKSGHDHGETSDGGGSTTADEDCPITYKCRACNVKTFKKHEIISSNYHAHTSPGYLLSAAHNIEVSCDKTTVSYTTGRYDIKEVSCKCGAVLGVTYSAAFDDGNKYKVGKFLVGRDRLVLPRGVVHPMDEQH